MKIHTNDKVKVISGKDKGKIGKVIKVYLADNRVLVEGVNIVKRHVKPGTVSKEGGIVSIERPINASNVMYFDDKLDKPVRLGKKIVESRKYRVNKVTSEALEK
jgi:large subunit ribosomal protein L24